MSEQPSDVAQRVRFFDGQYLTDEDFNEEQRYHLERAGRLHRALRITGVVDGFAVTAGGPNRVKIAPGTAIDAGGRQLDLIADGVELTIDKTFDGARLSVVAIARQTGTRESTGRPGGEGHRRWDDTPLIAVVGPEPDRELVATHPAGEAPDPAELPASVLLAQVSVGGDGQVTVHGTGDRAGLRLPGNLDIGTSFYDEQDRYLTMRAAGGGKHGCGVRLWHWAEDTGFSLDYDAREANGHGLHVRTHNGDPAGASRLFVSWPDGHVGVGTGAPENAEGWTKVVDVVSSDSAKLSLRTETGAVDGRVMAHATGFWESGAGMIIGTASEHPLSFGTGAKTRMTIGADGKVDVGGGLTVGTEGEPAELRVSGRLRASTRDGDGNETGAVEFTDDRFVGVRSHTTPAPYPATPQTYRQIGFFNNGKWVLTADHNGNVTVAGNVAARHLMAAMLTVRENGQFERDLTVSGRLLFIRKNYLVQLILEEDGVVRWTGATART